MQLLILPVRRIMGVTFFDDLYQAFGVFQDLVHHFVSHLVRPAVVSAKESDHCPSQGDLSQGSSAPAPKALDRRPWNKPL